MKFLSFTNKEYSENNLIEKDNFLIPKIRILLFNLSFFVQQIFIIYEDYRNKIGFHMLFAIGVFDCSQTVTHLIACIYYLAGVAFVGAMERVNIKLLIKKGK